MKILVTGGRNYKDKERIKKELQRYPEDSTLIHGDCRGLDRLAAEAAEELGFDVISVPAEWNKHGRAAGPIRNNKMLSMEPDVVIGFHKDIKKSKGTAHCLAQAHNKGIKAYLVED